MASLAIIVSIIVLLTIFIGPLTYILARLNAPNIIVYIMSAICFFAGINFCLLAIPVWYLGLIPIYFGYISIARTRKKEIQG